MTLSWVDGNSDGSKDYWYYDDDFHSSWSYLDYHFDSSSRLTDATIFNDDGTLRCSRSAPQHGHRKGQRQGNPSAQLR